MDCHLSRAHRHHRGASRVREQHVAVRPSPGARAGPDDHVSAILIRAAGLLASDRQLGAALVDVGAEPATLIARPLDNGDIVKLDAARVAEG